MCGLDTMARTGKEQEKVQFCENNWIRRIVGVKRANKRRMDELRVEVGVRETFKKKLVRGRVKWAGHVERMGDENLAKSRCPEGGGKEMRKTENATGGGRQEGEENGEPQQKTDGVGDC